ncbi:hypothetical protein J2Z26_000942 [Bacillus luteolus]|nr:hypothetical protein [Cytobacillus luteolus]
MSLDSDSFGVRPAQPVRIISGLDSFGVRPAQPVRIISGFGLVWRTSCSTCPNYLLIRTRLA